MAYKEEWFVTEACPHCDKEATVAWKPEEDGYEMYCPYCGERIMLCSVCPELHKHGRCDWNAQTGCMMKVHSKLDSNSHAGKTT